MSSIHPHGFVDYLLRDSGVIDFSVFEQRTAERIIKGKYRPSAAHWRIRKAGPRPESSWEVLDPLQFIGPFDTPPEFDTFEDACEYVAGKVDEWMTANPSTGYEQAVPATVSSGLYLHAGLWPR